MTKIDNVVRVDFAAFRKSSSEQETPTPATDPVSEEKLRCFSELIAKGQVLVTLDARRDDVKVPPDFKHNKALALNFNRLFQIADFVYDDIGLRATLSFPRGLFTCDIPWAAVYAFHPSFQEEGFVWAKDFPK